MCWNSQVSLLTFIIGIVVCYTLFKRNKPYDKVIGVFIVFYSFIQFCEFLMWKSLEGEKYGFKSPEELNLFATKMAYVNLYAHSAVIGYMLYLETQNNMYLLGALPLVYGLLNFPKIDKISKPIEESKGHLYWNIDVNFYVVVALIIFYFFYSIPLTRPMSLYFLVLYIISFTTSGKGSASNWCFISAFFSFYALIR
jgi:hypothetical protein